MSLIVASDEDRLRVVEAEETRRKFEDMRRMVAGWEGVFELMTGFVDDLLLACGGVGKRLSQFKGREVGSF